MIKNIFLPEQFRSYYLFPKRIVGFDINKTDIHATLITAYKDTKTIDLFIEEKIENNSELSYAERVSNTIKIILEKIGKYDAIYSSLSSNLVIFKELSLPFEDPKKIKMVLPFEVEPLLPFSLDTAIVDAVITKEKNEENLTEVLVAAVKKEYIQEHINFFKQADVEVDKITIDIFEFYGFFKERPKLFKTSESTALMEIGLHSTTLAIVINGQLKYIRTIPKGIITIAKKLQSSLNCELLDCLKYLYRSDSENNSQESRNIKDAITEFISDISFTVSAYTEKLKPDEKVKFALITGVGADILVLINSIEKEIGIKVKTPEVNKLDIQNKTTNFPQSCFISLATALSSAATQDFNIQKIEPITKEESVLSKQIITVLIFIFLIFTALFTFSIIRVSGLKKAYSSGQKETLEKLKKSFNLPDKSARTIKSAMNSAEAKLSDLQRKWSPLSHKNRFSFLKYLYELSKNINKSDTDLDLSSITIDQDEITLKGKVKDVDSLKVLETQLKSNLFVLEEEPQSPEFKERPIKLKIKDNKEE